KTVNPHLEDLLDRVLTESFDAGEREDGQRLAALHHTIAKFHRPPLAQQKVLIDYKQDQFRVEVEVPFGDGVEVLAFGQEPDVFARKEVRGTAEIAPVGTAQPAEDFARARDPPTKHLKPAYQQWLLVGHGDLRFAQQTAEEGHAFLPADVIAIGLEPLILQHGAVAAQDNFAFGRVLADQGDDLL